MKAFIPNLITLLNLMMGCVAVYLASQNQLIEAGIFMALGIFFDFFDGLVARVLKVSSELGKQLDSLADVVTSGVVPGIVMFQLLNDADVVKWHAYLGFFITLGSAYRLARFNIDSRQNEHFIGLPTPANAILILSLPFILKYENLSRLNELLLNDIFLIGLCLLSVFLLNMNVELFSLKLKSFRFSDNKLLFLFLIGAIVLLVLLKFIAIPLIILAYIFVSMIAKKNTAEN